MTLRSLTQSVAVVIALSCPSCASAETDFGQVGLYVARMLEKSHYSHQAFDDGVSAKLLENYLNYLDPRHNLFTQADVAGFRSAYSEKLDDAVMLRDLGPVTQIYELYKTRVKERVAYAERLLDANKFTFSGDRSVVLKRQKLPWPKDQAEAESLWHDFVEATLLQEIMNDEAKARSAAKKKSLKTDPAPAASKVPAGETPVERVKKDYLRLLQSVETNAISDVADYFLSCLATTYDPHSAYMSPSEMDNFTSRMGHYLFGIGSRLQLKDDLPTIEGIMIGGPADKQGELALNDKVIAVAQADAKWVDTKYLRLPKVVEMIRGKEGTRVHLRVIPARDPSSVKEISIVRGKVELKDNAANAELIESPESLGKGTRLGWIHLATFYGDRDQGNVSTTVDVEKLLRRLMKENITGLVLDLRGNGGGSLDEAIKLTGLFIPAGPVVQIKDADGRINVRKSSLKEPLYTGPMIVLTDKASASASEILAASLQDYRRAVVIGDHSTFGKGTVQNLGPVRMPFFADKAGVGNLKITIQKFYRIAGGSTQLKGVIPDLILPSLRDGMDFGEATHENALPFDQIPAATFDYARSTPLPVAELKARMEKRIKGNADLVFVAEETERLRKRIELESVSLDRKTREKERLENEQRRDNYEADRKARAKAVGDAGKNDFKTYLLSLGNVNDPVLVPMSADERAKMSGMKMAEKSADDEAGEDPDDNKYPYGIEPAKLECFHVLRDLIELQGSEPLTAKTPSLADNPAPAAKSK